MTPERISELLNYCDNEASNNSECSSIYTDLYSIVSEHLQTVNYAKYPREDWAMEVSGGDTLLGYAEWVEHRIESDEE